MWAIHLHPTTLEPSHPSKDNTPHMQSPTKQTWGWRGSPLTRFGAVHLSIGQGPFISDDNLRCPIRGCHCFAPTLAQHSPDHCFYDPQESPKYRNNQSALCPGKHNFLSGGWAVLPVMKPPPQHSPTGTAQITSITNLTLTLLAILTTFTFTLVR